MTDLAADDPKSTEAWKDMTAVPSHPSWHWPFFLNRGYGNPKLTASTICPNVITRSAFRSVIAVGDPLVRSPAASLSVGSMVRSFASLTIMS